MRDAQATSPGAEPLYADVILDITHEKLDRVYQYRVPDGLRERMQPGVCVEVPFGRGNRMTRGYVLALRNSADFDPERTKEIGALSERGVTIESQLIRLALWIRKTYGCTMIQALKTVLPVRDKEPEKRQKLLVRIADDETARGLLEEAERRGHRAKARLITRLLEQKELLQAEAMQSLSVGTSTIASLAGAGFLEVRSVTVRKAENPDCEIRKADSGCHEAGDAAADEQRPVLSEEQRAAADAILESWRSSPGRPALLEGVTGSGKTLVYMELAEQMLQAGRQVIILIPEIALSWQTVRRFRRRFGEVVTVIHSRMGVSGRYDYLERVTDGRAQIVVGPRSALFTPFPNLGLIILDEEQETSYRSEETPRYDARETAIERARIEGAEVVFGSATPSVDSVRRCRQGSWLHVHLTRRYGTAVLPDVRIVDLREELRAGNRSMLSRELQEQLSSRLEHREQAILFLNKRGLAGFLSCRSCGSVLKCPHCDVSLTAHQNGMLICHYCNYRTPLIRVCPSCGSPHLSGLRAGTQKIEQTVKKLFPDARVLRMDADTTGGKEGHEKILQAFAAREADILIGTQMIVKGHDFPNVTLVGVLLADLSLFASDYRAAERTYQLIVQAVGRAGRGQSPGSALIQTYQPEHYSIQAAAKQDYEAFYEQEMAVRDLLQYPPAAHLMTIHLSCRDPETLQKASVYLKQYLLHIRGERPVALIGPAPEAVARVQEYYRAAVSMKGNDLSDLLHLRQKLELYIEVNHGFDTVRIQYDLDR